MKRIVLLAVLSLSLFSAACCSDASTCEEAYENTKDECASLENSTISEKEPYVTACNENPQKEAQIECSNSGSCIEILKCGLNLIGTK
jgi:hypothetical protein